MDSRKLTRTGSVCQWAGHDSEEGELHIVKDWPLGLWMDDIYLDGEACRRSHAFLVCLSNPYGFAFMKDKARGLSFVSILFLKSSLILAKHLICLIPSVPICKL